MQKEYHRQRQVGDGNESEEGPQKHGDAATGTFDASEEGDAGYVATHTGGDHFGEEPAR